MSRRDIGGCVATCAGGSHSFGYGSICAAVHAVEYVDAGGERRLVTADDDAAALESLVGSEGTLGVIVATVLRGELLPRPRAMRRVARRRGRRTTMPDAGSSTTSGARAR